MSGEIIDTEVKVIDRRNDYSIEPVQSQQTDLVLIALQNKYDPAIIEKMLELSERNQKNIARQAYFDALAHAKAEFPPVKKDMFNKRYESWYTSLGMLHETYNPILGKYGLSLSYPLNGESIQDNKLVVAVRLSHAQGHYEEIKIPFPIDEGAIGKTSGVKSRNDIQDIKSTFTYARSMLTEAILGVSGTEASIEDDGNSGGQIKGTISEAQAAEISSGIKAKNIPLTSFLSVIAKGCGLDKIENINSIPEKAYKECIRIIGKAKAIPKTISCPRHDGKDAPLTECDTCPERTGCPSHE